MFATRVDRQKKKLNLAKISTKPPKTIARDRAETRFSKLGRELFELQELMYGAATHSLLIVLQGRDTAGKDGTVKHVVGHLNPRSVHMASFGVPSEEELAHDFLWRIHQHTPAKGNVAIFNRSHYEDVLVVRVHNLAPKPIWSGRFNLINAFEEQLASAGTIILKFFLHISKSEQEERLLERERDPTKAWKLNVGDWKEREHWSAYTRAYEAAITKCAKKQAPWFIVPADKKWFRNLAVAEALHATLSPHRDTWRKVLRDQGKKRKEEIVRFRTKGDH